MFFLCSREGKHGSGCRRRGCRSGLTGALFGDGRDLGSGSERIVTLSWGYRERNASRGAATVDSRGTGPHRPVERESRGGGYGGSQCCAPACALVVFLAGR